MALKLPKFMNPMPRTKSHDQLCADAWQEWRTIARLMTDAGYPATVALNEPAPDAMPWEIQQAAANLRNEWNAIRGKL